MVQQPQFTWWPYRLLALGIPLLAALFAYVTWQESQNQEQATLVFFLMLATGNAYLMSTAIGDFGRSVIAIPVGAGAALLCVSAMAYPLGRVIVCAALCLLLITHFLYKDDEFAAKMIGVVPTLMMGGAIGFELWHNRIFGFEFPVCYLFVCALITASMPYEQSVQGIWIASYPGLRSALWGLAPGFLAGAAILTITKTVRVAAHGVDVYFAAATGIGAACANFTCTWILFTSVARTAANPAPVSTVSKCPE